MMMLKELAKTPFKALTEYFDETKWGRQKVQDPPAGEDATHFNRRMARATGRGILTSFTAHGTAEVGLFHAIFNQELGVPFTNLALHGEVAFATGVTLAVITALNAFRTMANAHYLNREYTSRINTLPQPSRTTLPMSKGK